MRREWERVGEGWTHEFKDGGLLARKENPRVPRGHAIRCSTAIASKAADVVEMQISPLPMRYLDSPALA